MNSAAEPDRDLKELQGTLLEQFVSATRHTLREMASVEAVVSSINRHPPAKSLATMTAVLGLGSATQGYLLLTFSERTATAVAERVLAGVTDDLNESLIRDCIGEVANVVAGQAKALLAETPFRVTLSMPKVVTDPIAELEPFRALDCESVVFSTDLGAFTLYLLRRCFASQDD